MGVGKDNLLKPQQSGNMRKGRGNVFVGGNQ